MNDTHSSADKPKSFDRNLSTSGMPPANVGLVLSGGGARGAYQAGVLQGLTEIATKSGTIDKLNVLTGVSAGAINAAFLAAKWSNPAAAGTELATLWTQLEAEHVFKTDALTLGQVGLRWIADASVGALYKRKLARSLLETDPLLELLKNKVDFSDMRDNIRSGRLHSLAITAMSYATATSLTFVQGRPDVPMWNRTRRHSQMTELDARHVLASSAIPLFFPPVKIDNDHFGDGVLRNTAPLSPAIHLGAKKLLVISVRRPDHVVTTPPPNYEPSIARVLGVIMNALFLDAVEIDMERLSRINTTLTYIPEETKQNLSLRPMEYLWIRPSEDIGLLAAGQFKHLPRMVRYLMGGLGSSKEASELTSYLLFEPEFCSRLVAMGYRDAMNRRDEITSFLEKP